MCRSGTSQDKFIYASSEHFAIARDFWRGRMSGVPRALL
jgi:hypothetical protein